MILPMSALVCLLSLSGATARAELALADPTQPLSYQQARSVKVSYQLNSIFRGDGKTKAIINGQLMAEGQKKGNLELVSVADSSVTIRTPEGVEMLYLHPRVKRAMHGN